MVKQYCFFLNIWIYRVSKTTRGLGFVFFLLDFIKNGRKKPHLTGVFPWNLCIGLYCFFKQLEIFEILGKLSIYHKPINTIVQKGFLRFQIGFRSYSYTLNFHSIMTWLLKIVHIYIQTKVISHITMGNCYYTANMVNSH